MKGPRLAYNIACGVILFGVMVLLSSCQLGHTAMLSKGEAGGFAQIFSGNAEYCKYSSTEEIVMSAEAQEAFVKYCADVE